MGEILGLGLTHYPPLALPDEHMAGLLRATLADEALPEALSRPSAWPTELQREYGDDQGTAAAAEHRDRLREGFRHMRKALDEFAPDVVLVWGDDQYEVFREQCIPAFCVLAYGDLVVRPWTSDRLPPNVWGEGPDAEVLLHGARPVGKALTAGLLDAGFDVAYAYEPRTAGAYPHAFLNTVLYLDYDRQGFDYPLLPVSVNCYGQYVVKRRGGMGVLAEMGKEVDLDPPSPSPARCMQLGAATARFFLESDLRVALIASSSWSHAFLTDKHWRLYPDVEADRRLFEALRAGDFATWRSVTLDDIDASGQQEMLNWFCLVGAMEEAGHQPTYCELVESFAFNSDKCFAAFSPSEDTP